MSSVPFIITFCTILEITNVTALSPTDCFEIEDKIRDSCFTFNSTPVTFSTAEKNCALTGGQMAIIQDENTWELLIQKFLQGQRQYIWMGYKVVPDPPRIIPNVRSRNVSKYWSTITLLVSDVGKCLYSAHHISRRWGFSECEKYSYGYFCQFFPSCKISRINNPNVIIQSCLTSDIVLNDLPVKIECSQGHYLNTSSTIFCRNGFWDHQVQCVPGCPPPGKKRHSELTSNKTLYSIGEKIYYVCEDNYYSWKNHDQTHFSITCQEDSMWSDRESRCSRRSDVSTSTVNRNNLKCDLNATNKNWYRNGDEINHYSTIDLMPSGNLIINSTLGYNNGYYVCSGIVNGKLEIGSTGYERMIWDDCDIDEQFLRIRHIIASEGENLLMNCPQLYKDHKVKWCKDGEEIISSERRNVISGLGLFLKSISLHDEGIYKCQRNFISPKISCVYNITHNLIIISTVENVCGVTDIQDQTKQPWIAVLRRDDESLPFCYGTLINRHWIITSAFCLSYIQRKKNLDGVYLELGPDGDKRRYEVSRINIHPGYVTRHSNNDIGLIKIYISIRFNKNVLPVCMTAEDIENINNCEHRSRLTGEVSGWDSEDDFGKRNFDIEKFAVIPKKLCRALNMFGFAEDKFCGKVVGGNNTLARSDGLPFLVSVKGRQYLLGIYTWSERKMGIEYYDYFTSIYYHYDWIKDVIGS